VRHCSVEFRKHVLPRLYRPAPTPRSLSHFKRNLCAGKSTRWGDGMPSPWPWRAREMEHKHIISLHRHTHANTHTRLVRGARRKNTANTKITAVRPSIRRQARGGALRYRKAMGLPLSDRKITRALYGPQAARYPLGRTDGREKAPYLPWKANPAWPLSRANRRAGNRK